MPQLINFTDLCSEYREKVNITVNEDNDTIHYILKKTYFFNQKDSGCRSEDDVVSILNAGLVVRICKIYLKKILLLFLFYSQL